VAKRTWLLGLLTAAAGWLLLVSRPEPPAELSERTGVVAVARTPRGLDWPKVDRYPAVQSALRGTDPDALRRALERNGLRALWVPSTPERPWGPELSLEDRFAAGGIVRGFRGAYLSADGMLYVVDRTAWPEALAAETLARVARQILSSGQPPPPSAFPEPFASPQSVEVVVLLRSGTGPRLWRSARAESIAEGLVTAALAARRRWAERSETMGGPLEGRLDELDVEVGLLFDDGTIAVEAPSLIDALVKPAHGVAYEQPTRWRYLLPAATHTGRPPSAAYRELFEAHGLPEESFGRSDLRLYRMRMKTLSVDYGSAGSKPRAP